MIHTTIFRQSILWNLFDALSYGLLITVHQTGLFYYAEAKLTGQMGALCGIIYSIAAIATIGTDLAISSHLPIWNSNQYSAYRYFKKQLIINYCIAIVILICILSNRFISILVPHNLSFLVGTIVMIEVTRKLLKHMLMMVLQTKTTCVIEIMTMVLYATIIWTKIAITHQIDLETLVYTLFFSSLVSTIILGFYTTLWYQQLPKTEESSLLQTNWGETFLTRAAYAFQDIPIIVFSHNSISPLIALSNGFELAAICKIAMGYAHLTINSISKVCAIQSMVIYAHSTNTVERKHGLSTMNYYVLGLSLAITPILFIIFKLFFPLQSNLIYLCVIMVVLQNISAIMERYLLYETALSPLPLLNSSILIMIAFAWRFIGITPYIFMALFIITKMVLIYSMACTIAGKKSINALFSS